MTARRRTVLAGALAASLARAAQAQQPAWPAAVSQSTSAGEVLGLVAAVSAPGGDQVAAAGQSGNGRPLDGDSIFEIGSVTKMFTAMLLAAMAGRGEVALADPVAAFLPPEGRPPPFDGKPMTLLDLATHTSGLPRMPAAIVPSEPGNPYADYTVAELYVAASQPARRYPGSFYEYSNLGFGLLGHALALRAGIPYEDLLVARVLRPLGLYSTRITLTPEMAARLVPGHDGTLRPVPNWTLPVFAGAGALRSSVNDLARFVGCCLGRVPSPVAPWLATMLDVRRQTGGPLDAVAAGWFVREARQDEVVWKDGDTGGYTAFVGYSTRNGTGSVVLSNTSSPLTTPRLGLHLLNPAFPLPAAWPVVTLAPSQLDALTGHYEVSRGFVLTVRPDRGRLSVQATGQDAAPVFAESATRFYYRIVDAQLTFQLGPDGQATAVTLHQNGRDMRGSRQPLQP